jgi:hypothetical protein
MTAYVQAMTAYVQAITAYVQAMTAYAQAMTAYAQAMTACVQAMTACVQAMTAYVQAMTAPESPRFGKPLNPKLQRGDGNGRSPSPLRGRRPPSTGPLQRGVRRHRLGRSGSN